MHDYRLALDASEPVLTEAAALAQCQRTRQRLLLTLWLGSSVLLALGLSRPIIKIAVNVESVLRDAIDRQPIIGLLLQEHGVSLADIAPKLPPASETRQSVWSSAMKLLALKCYLAAALILFFSIMVPIAKQALLLLSLTALPLRSTQLTAVAQAIHKWSMLDVFALSMIVLVLSSAAAWTSELLDGFLWFVCYVLCAGLLGALSTRLNRATQGPAVATRSGNA